MLYASIFPSTISPTHCVRPRAFTDTDLTTSTNARVAHTNENHLDSPSAYTHTYVRTCNTILLSCLSFSFHPSSLFLSVSSVSSNVVCWLQTGSWKLAIQDIDQLTRPTHPPPSILLSPSHTVHACLSFAQILSLSFASVSRSLRFLLFPERSPPLFSTIAKQSVCQTLLLIVHLIRSFLPWYSTRILYKSR